MIFPFVDMCIFRPTLKDRLNQNIYLNAISYQINGKNIYKYNFFKYIPLIKQQCI